MRPISQIKRDIDDVKKEMSTKLQSLQYELNEIMEKCPHPRDFLTVQRKDVDDNGPGVPQYDYSYMTVTCSLCEKRAVSEQYHRSRDVSPIPEELIQKAVDSDS